MVIIINKKFSTINKVVLGIEFVSLIISPVIFFILGGLYLQAKYNFSDTFIIFCVIASILFMIVNIILFIYKIINIYTPSSKKGENNENKRNT